MLGIHIPIGFQVVQTTTQTPCPRPNGTPLIRRWLRLPFLVKQGMHTILKSVVEVRVKVSVINGRQPITSRQYHLDLPPTRFRPSTFLRGTVLSNFFYGIVAHPLRRQCNAWVLVNCVVPVEVQAQKHPRWTHISLGQ